MRKIRERGEQYKQAVMQAEANALAQSGLFTGSGNNTAQSVISWQNQNPASYRSKTGEPRNMKNSKIRTANSIAP
ncbi:MAG: hypothetical protein U0M08_07780 [Clostridia bacterium]|nr:hypothetical protein [Clostridia bacterium]